MKKITESQILELLKEINLEIGIMNEFTHKLPEFPNQTFLKIINKLGKITKYLNPDFRPNYFKMKIREIITLLLQLYYDDFKYRKD